MHFSEKNRVNLHHISDLINAAFYDKKDTEAREANRFASANILANLGVKLLLNQPINETDVNKLLPADLLRYHKAKAAAQKTSNTNNKHQDQVKCKHNLGSIVDFSGDGGEHFVNNHLVHCSFVVHELN